MNNKFDEQNDTVKFKFVELRKSVFIKENIDETIFMFALFKCRKSDKGRN